MICRGGWYCSRPYKSICRFVGAVWEPSLQINYLQPLFHRGGWQNRPYRGLPAAPKKRFLLSVFGVEDMQEWDNLMSLLKNFRLNEEEDQLIGFWRNQGCICYQINVSKNNVQRGGLNKRIEKLWKNSMLLKLKIFLWLDTRNKVQSGVNMNKKKWKGSHNSIL